MHQSAVLNNNITIYITIYIKTAPTFFAAVSHTVIREHIIRAC
jgi:hypothetical protein